MNETRDFSASVQGDRDVAGESASEIVLSPRQLMWRKFRSHKLAMVGTAFVLILYTVALFAEFFAPYDPRQTNSTNQLRPPQLPRFLDEDGRFYLRPFVYPMEQSVDPQTWSVTYQLITDQRYHVRLFVFGDPYTMWGVFDGKARLFGVDGGGRWNVLGTDRVGRDLLSRIMFGARISGTIGLVGVAFSLVLGVTLGGVSGYYGGHVDNIIQRTMELLRSIPEIPLWMALAAAVPRDWSPIAVYFAITLILSLIGWTTVGREVRSKFLSLRNEEFVMAARIGGTREMSIILRHMLPACFSHVIARVTLAIPVMIIAETSLSFLGVGLRAPTISWGVLMQAAQNIHAVALAPWLMLPGVAVVVTVLAFNFAGDGVRDAADPFSE